MGAAHRPSARPAVRPGPLLQLAHRGTTPRPQQGRPPRSPTLTTGPALVRGTVIQGRDSPQILQPPLATPPRPTGGYKTIRIRVGKHTRVVRRCHGGSGYNDVTYSHGVVSGQEVGQPFVDRVASGKTYKSQFPQGYERLQPVTHTAKHHFFSTSGRGPTRSAFQTLSYQARIPTR